MGIADRKYMCKGPGAWGVLGMFDEQQRGWCTQHVGLSSFRPCPWGPLSLEGRNVFLGPQPMIDAQTDFPVGQRSLFVSGWCQNFPQRLGSKQLFLLWWSVLGARHSTPLTCMVSSGFLEGKTEAQRG